MRPLTLVVAIVCAPAFALGTVVTFEDPSFGTSSTLVPNGYSGFDWDKLEEELHSVRWRVIFLPMPELQIASSMLQQRMRQGRPLRYQVLPQVEAYIHEHNLYRLDWEDE